MSRSLFDATAVRDVLHRLERLTADRRPAWGRMSAGQMVCHLLDYFDVALGRRHCPPAVPRLLQPVVRFVLVRWTLPYPRNARTLPTLLETRPGDFSTDRERLAAAIREFADRRDASQWPPSPIAGRVSGADWARLAYEHLQHHLRQFRL